MNKSHQNHSPIAYDDEIDLRELFRVLWAGKWLIGATIMAATMITVVVALMLPNIYRAEVLLAPNDQGGAGGSSALISQYGGLASLAGINLGDSQGGNTALGLEILKSRKFISEFVEHHDILVPLIAARGWDVESKELIVDADDYDQASKRWIRKVSPPRKTTPSMQEAHEEFLAVLSESTDKDTGFVRISVEHYSPHVAKQWVDWLVSDLNMSIMRQDVSEAEQAIEYLNEQIQNTSLAELQNVFFRLIEEQTKTVMLAKVTDEYLFKTLDPAVVAEKQVKPKRLLIVILGAILGALFGILVVAIRHWSQHGGLAQKVP